MFAELKKMGLGLPRSDGKFCQRHRLVQVEGCPRPASVAQPISTTHVNAGVVE